MIAVDTNLLVYSHRTDSPWHAVSQDAIGRLAEGRTSWAIPWPCIHEFFSIVTHPRIYLPPTPAAVAIDAISAWIESPTLRLLAESDGYWPELRSVLETGRIAGPKVHDARIVALCAHHGVTQLWSADRDFSRFPGLTVHNPLLA